MNLSFINTAFDAVSSRPGIVIAAGTATIIGGSAWAVCKTFKVARTVDYMSNLYEEHYVADGDYYEENRVYDKKTIALQAGKMYIAPAIVVLAGIGMVACGLHWLGGVGVVLSAAPAAASVIDKVADVPEQPRNSAATSRDENEVNDDGDCAELSGYGRYLFRDPETGRMFYSDKATIRQAVLNLDERFGHDGQASYADFFEFMGLDACECAYDLVWMYDAQNCRSLSVTFSNYELNRTDCPCLEINFNHRPNREYID